MGTAQQDLQQARALPEGDAIRILLTQHAHIRELLDEVRRSSGEERRQAFEELRGFLVVHETAEEMVLRPVTAKVVSQDVADRRNHEEQQANEMLAALEDLDPDGPDFEEQFSQFASDVGQHAEQEESEEFPGILTGCDVAARRSLGRRLEAAERVAPTRPHPSAAGSTVKQWTVGPFAALVDRTRDALEHAGRD